MLWILGPVGAGIAIEADVARGYDWRHHKMWGVEELTAYAPCTIVNPAPFWAMLPVISSAPHRSIYPNQGLLEATILHPEGMYAETPHRQRSVVAYLLQC